MTDSDVERDMAGETVCGFRVAAWRAGSHKLTHETPSARITGDKDRENPVEGAPYGEGLIGRIDQLEHDLALARRGWAYAQDQQLRLMTERTNARDAMRQIADAEYADHLSGNENFERLQRIAREAGEAP